MTLADHLVERARSHPLGERHEAWITRHGMREEGIHVGVVGIFRQGRRMVTGGENRPDLTVSRAAVFAAAC
jgi:hypothetical protein